MTAPKRKPGRPKGRAKPPTAIVGVRFTAEQKAAIEAAAGQNDLSAWIREMALRAAGRSDLGIAATVAALGVHTQSAGPTARWSRFPIPEGDGQ